MKSALRLLYNLKHSFTGKLVFHKRKIGTLWNKENAQIYLPIFHDVVDGGLQPYRSRLSRW